MTTPELLLKEKIYSGPVFEVYRGEYAQQPVVIKRNVQAFPSAKDLATLRHEFEIGKKAHAPTVIHYLALERIDQRLSLIMSDVHADSLDKVFPNYKIDIQTTLNIIIQVCDALVTLHQNNIIHKDIKPSNILYNTQTQAVKVIDFSISSELSNENQVLTNPDKLEGSLAYISPEQTGRMNRHIDYRSDFYSLGITFFQLLAGQLPFASEDPMELTHSHLARTPPSIQEFRPEVPNTLARIIQKLLAKNAEDRYQSAYGLKYDLQTCLENYQKNGTIPDFNLATKDISDKFSIPQKLYGREKELQQLLKSFEKAAAGSSEILLVTGYSGIGKSVLVNEVHKPIVRQRGYFISGKFDQFKRNIPYSALIQAFRGLVLQILSEPQNKIDEWKNQLLTALGANGQIITDVIQEVELVIGKPAPVPVLPLTEAQNRFNFVFLKFIQVFATVNHPLVIFLDDLQWADSATLSLLERLLTDPDSRYLLVLGAYRNNEVDVAHPLRLTLQELQKKGISTPEIVLMPLDAPTIAQMTADTLYQSPIEVKPLAEIIYQKTSGNPFFVSQFLRTLYEEKNIIFDNTKGSWVWDTAKAGALSISDNVIELMIRKLQKLAPATQRILQLAACIGNEFDLLTLATVYEQPPFVSAIELKEAVFEELLIAKGDFNRLVLIENIGVEDSIQFKFLHDRVQQAAYAMIPEETRKSVHLTIGRLLLASMPPIKWEEHIFDLVNQLNQGAEYIDSPKEKQLMIKLNLKAAAKARASTAYQPARQYLTTALQLLPPNHWQTEYTVSCTLYQALAESEYLCKNFEVAEKLFDALLTNVQTKPEKAKVLLTKITLYTNIAQFEKAVAVGLSALKLFAVSLPRNPPQIRVLPALLGARLALGTRSVESLKQSQPMTHPEKLLCMSILMEILAPAYVQNQFLFALVVLKMVTLSLKYGNAPASSFAYLAYGTILGGELGDYKKGYAFGKLALELSEHFNDPIQIGKANFAYGYFLMGWTHDLRETYPYIKKSFPLSIEAGDLVYAIYSVQFLVIQLFRRGEPLAEVRKQALVSLEFLRKSGDEGANINVGLALQYARCLAGETLSPTSLNSSTYDEDAVLQTLIAKNLPTMILYHIHFIRAELRFLYGNPEEALVHLNEAAKFHEAVFSMAMFAEHFFVQALMLAGAYSKTSAEKKSKYKAQLNTCIKKMRTWAKFSPNNYAHRLQLMLAEKFRIDGNESQAQQYYTQAIEQSRKLEYLNLEALACELYAQALYSWGKQAQANEFIQQAHFAYQNWGAFAKAQHLQAQHPTLNWGTETTQTPFDVTVTATRSTQSLDILTVMKASQTISGEIKLDRLLEKLMKIVIENAGAERGFLIFENNGQLTIEAEAELGRENVAVLQSLAIDSGEYLPVSIINYVYRTQEIIIKTNAAEIGRFSQDDYVVKKQLKSALCMPVMHQGALTAILYLENNLVAGAFTQERIEVLQMLSSQIAISIDNAKLYETLEQKVAERTAEVMRQKEELEQKNEDITESITYARRIQFGILPPLDIMQRNFPNSFVFYQPRDIVSGDFYWFAECEGWFLVSAVDCTGHGVPGAFMSVMGNGFLNQIVREYKLYDSAQILNELHKKVVQNLASDESTQKLHDGMDLAICSIHPETRRMIYSSANRPVYWFGKDGFKEIKGEKLPIGGSTVSYNEKGERFSAQYFDLNPGDTIYLFSDGITDQFGGDKGRKYTSKRFLALIESLQPVPMQEQGELIRQEIMVNWQGKYHQTDDVLVIGLKID